MIGQLTKRSNVLPAPLNYSALIKESKILPRRTQSCGIRLAKDVESVVEGDYDVIWRAINPLRWNLIRDILPASVETAAVDEDQYWQTCTLGFATPMPPRSALPAA